MTIENDIDLLVSDVTTRKAAVVKANADLDAIVAEGVSAAGQAESAALAALSARDEASDMATASGALATASVGATAYADLAAVAAAKVEDAVDVFIYDTSLDSDGGAWRYRTQGTSWYREALNTATRGSRREFPAVAVIVVESAKVTIYDGDDPAMPMWMVIQSGAGALPSIWRTARPALCAAMLNGVLCIGLSGSDSGYTGLYVAEFVADEVYRVNPLGTYGASLSVARRNDQSALVSVISATAILNGTVNDVAMTVLPDAPIDPATGLPVPTVAAATAGGASVIKGDGTVVSTQMHPNQGGGLSKVGIYGSKVAVSGISTTAYYGQNVWDFATGQKFLMGSLSTGDLALGQNSPYERSIFANSENDYVGRYWPGGQGLGFIDWNNFASSLALGRASSYITGWMPGAIKGAWLADIEADDLRKVELVTNGGFDTADGWTLAEYASILGGFASWSNAPHNDVFLSRGGFSVVAGKQYLVEYDQTNVGSSTKVYMDFGFTTVASNASQVSQVVVASGTASNAVKILNAGSGGSGTIDNLSITPLEQDRAVSRKGLSIFGRLRRAPVADGAELVGYAGWSADNYLEGTDASYVDTLYALGWEQTNGRWGFKHGVVSAAPIDGLTVTGNTLRIAGTKPKALIRLTATVPTADQIAKIEADERTLFQSGAQCTLYGASNIVTALAYDKVTNLLHVGTSAGRSVFDGLRRVAHTTQPVGAAIAAHNGLIIED